MKKKIERRSVSRQKKMKAWRRGRPTFVGRRRLGMRRRRRNIAAKACRRKLCAEEASVGKCEEKKETKLFLCWKPWRHVWREEMVKLSNISEKWCCEIYMLTLANENESAKTSWRLKAKNGLWSWRSEENSWRSGAKMAAKRKWENHKSWTS